MPLGKAAIIASIQLSQDNTSPNSEMTELRGLLKTLGIPVVAEVTQARQRLDPKSLMGAGKVSEIKSLAESTGADLVVFDRPLSGPQVRNLEKMTCLTVYDRTGVILEIFSRHARTRQAKTQVEIARLEYLLPRLTGAWTHFQRQAGGAVRSRGMGETQIEVDRRRARLRISRLQARLKRIEQECATRRKARGQEWKVAIVGYTNSGKTTLMARLTQAQLDGQNELFATLDTKVRTLSPKSRPKILITDTVGFIRQLPTALVASFKSTLQEVTEADLLLHVVDLSDPNYREHMHTTRSILTELNADHIETLTVFNKVDALEDQMLPRILRSAYAPCMVISSFNKTDVDMLRDKVLSFFTQHLASAVLTVPHRDALSQSQIFSQCMVQHSDYSDPGHAIFHVKASRAVLMRLKPFIVKFIDKPA